MCIRDDHQDIVIESNADEDVTTYQEHLASYMNVMLQRIRNVYESDLRNMLQRIRIHHASP